uniref:Serpin domain-containing protein n=1 Tax=Sus scrofa TaxID=9823 RepID=A0A8D1SVR6_PIG
MHLADCLLLLLAGLLALSQGQLHSEHQGHSHHPHQEAPGTGKGSLSLRISPGNTVFALHFYHLMVSQTPGSNIFFSPLSISAAYAMLSLGAGSLSRTQILEGLGFNLTEVSQPDTHQGFQNLLHTLHLPDDRLEIHMGNALFLSPEVLPNFYTPTSKPAGTAQLINNHVKEETQGKIVDLVSGLSPDTTMVLGRPGFNWISVDEVTTVKVPMMMQGPQHHWYLHDRHFPCTVLRVDYKGDATALFILPNQGKMDEVEEVLTPEMLTRWRNLYFYKKIKLYIPKFIISGSYELDQILPKLGIIDLFSQRADFSGITEQLNLQVSKSFHKAILEVDEVGTQASAATGSFFTFLSRDNQQALWFNRPFLVAIFSTSTQSILFLGKVVNPKKL